MIRFRATSSIINNNATWIDSQYTGSIIALKLTSSYSGEKTEIFGNVTSAKYNGAGSWVLFNTSGSSLPTSSGQYDVSIYGASTGVQLTWGEYAVKWGEANQTWGNVEGRTATETLLSEDRVFISGSDYDTITTYNYQDNPVYSVYNG